MDVAPGRIRMTLVLLIEDDPDSRLMMRFHLEERGHETIEAADGVEGLVAAALHHPDAIVLNVLMPFMDGFTTLRHLKRLDATAALPTLICTAGKFRDRDIAEGVLLGADAYIPKPFELAELMAVVEALIAGGCAETSPAAPFLARSQLRRTGSSLLSEMEGEVQKAQSQVASASHALRAAEGRLEETRRAIEAMVADDRTGGPTVA